ncbi:Crp/Fnr family transcriptional regulator [Virgisporangium ochraceum]|uniref:Crp/Fnr family transcriptional regulator n=1 Tax=Virgisporangium ochraceum TaxID=65505 RepID=A0A8J3ZT81_9ACTN|nr:Crp/Fnr family transcriptional regulator [Virgisporangium ochraceum]GIJ70054.1 Crp/Fnr family transcriptional regulator [Virgisporangium ochraceum]
MEAGNAWRPATLLGRLPPPVRSAFLELGVPKRFARNVELISEGTNGRQAFLILRGHVKVTTGTDTGTALLSVRGEGDLIGDMAAISGLPRSATVTTCTAVEARLILHVTLHDFIARHRVAGELINARVVEQLHFANRRRVEYATRTVVQRLAAVIDELAQVCGEPTPGGGIRLPAWFPQADIADLVGASEGSVQRELGKLREQKLIDTRYRSVVILDRAGLAAVADPRDPS